VPIASVRRRRTIPEPVPEIVQAFTLTDGEKLAAAFWVACFAEVEVRRAKAARSFPSLDDALRTAREFPTFISLLGLLAPSEREEAWDEIAREWGRFTGPSGVVMPGEQIVLSGENRP
jgi:hypothetical protein